MSAETNVYKPDRREMLVEALEFYIRDMMLNGCNQAALDSFIALKMEIEEENAQFN